jgi:hypothetical protein
MSIIVESNNYHNPALIEKVVEESRKETLEDVISIKDPDESKEVFIQAYTDLFSKGKINFDLFKLFLENKKGISENAKPIILNTIAKAWNKYHSETLFGKISSLVQSVLKRIFSSPSPQGSGNQINFLKTNQNSFIHS